MQIIAKKKSGASTPTTLSKSGPKIRNPVGGAKVPLKEVLPGPGQYSSHTTGAPFGLRKMVELCTEVSFIFFILFLLLNDALST
jgi:hypothetical protein